MELQLLLVAWVSIGPLIYAPFKLQRRMVEGLHVPLCALATVGLLEHIVPTTLGSGWLERIAE